MTYLIAAAGTGGHVFPALSVGEALAEMGVTREEILFVGGDRLETKVFPESGFPFLGLELRGLKRSLSPQNLTLPLVVINARNRIIEAIDARETRVALGMGGYATIPAVMAASSAGIPFLHCEQNARAGLANRVAARWARRTFLAFPETKGLESGEWVGNPVRPQFWDFDRERLRPRARDHYRLSGDQRVLGVVGGSLGAKVLNRAVAAMVEDWDGPEIAILHLTGREAPGLETRSSPSPPVDWRRIEFETEMALFFAMSDLVVARAGGAVAELTATATPSVLVPGSFGSAGHQRDNAAFMTRAGAAVTLLEEDIGRLGDQVGVLITDNERLAAMQLAASRIARPEAARRVAAAMVEAAS